MLAQPLHTMANGVFQKCDCLNQWLHISSPEHELPFHTCFNLHTSKAVTKYKMHTNFSHTEMTDLSLCNHFEVTSQWLTV